MKFFRLRLAPTALSNVVAGAALGGAVLDLTGWIVLLTWTTSLYMAGMGLNDLVDRNIDRKRAPHRPLPSGTISLQSARWALLIVSIPTILLLMVMPDDVLIHATTAIACAFLYNIAFKEVYLLGPLVMGTVRYSIVLAAANYACPGEIPVAASIHALTIGLFTAAVTFFSQAEEEAKQRTLDFRLILVFAIPFSTGISMDLGHFPDYALQLCGTVVILLWILRGRAYHRGTPASHCTPVLLMALPLLDLRSTITYSLDGLWIIHLLAWLSLRPLLPWGSTPSKSQGSTPSKSQG